MAAGEDPPAIDAEPSSSSLPALMSSKKNGWAYGQAKEIKNNGWLTVARGALETLE